jgi:anti-sigma regulatory factor (Ser/Thr protein kinase)
MCRINSADFDGGPHAPSEARAWISHVLETWDASAISETANLLTSELVSNAVRHAHSGPSITAAMVDGFLEVGVSDGLADQIPQVGSATNRTVVGGRGIAIVEALSADWGVQVHPEGKQVWFRIRADDWPFLPACRCPDDHLGKVTLGSGREVLPNAGPWDIDVNPG